MGLAIILIPGGFQVESAYATPIDFYQAFALYVSYAILPPTKNSKMQYEQNWPSLSFQIFGWFIFTFILWILTIRSTLAFSSLFFTVWITFICLGVAYLDARNTADGHPHHGLTVAGGAFGIIAAFIAWYNMLAGLADPSNSFFALPVVHFPWSEKGRSQRKRDDDSAV
jgi:succinate-acetate transporter protein